MAFRGFLISALSTLFIFSSVYGEDVVVESRLPLKLSSQEIKLNSESEEEVVRELPTVAGVDLISLSPSPSPRDRLSLRGFTPERIYAYYGELPLNGSGIRGNFYFDLSTIPLLTKGVKVILLPSPIYGSSPGGSVILEPKGFPLKREFSLNLSGGSYNTFKGSLAASVPGELWGLNLGLEGLSTDGYLRNDYLKKRGLEVALYRLLGDYSILRLVYQGFKVKDGLPVLNSPKISLSNYDDDYPTVETTYFSLGCAPYCRLNLIDRDDSNYIDRTVNRLALSLFSEVGPGELEGHLYFNWAKKREDYYGLFKTPSGVKLSEVKIEGRDDFTYGFRTLYSAGPFKVGAEFQNSGYGEIEKNGKTLAPSNLHALKRGSLFGEFKFSFKGAEIDWGLRLERWVAERAARGLELLPFFSISKGPFYAGLGRVYRPPKPEEILWFTKERPLLGAKGIEPDLKAERGWDFEAGFKAKNFSLRAFHYRLKDYIVSNFPAAELLGLSFPHRIVENLDWVRSSGLEVSVVKDFSLFALYASYSYESFSHSSSRFTPSKTPSPATLVPKHKLFSSLKRNGIFGKRDWAELSFKAYSKRKGLTDKVPGFAVFDLSYGVRLRENANLKLTLYNLFNRKYCFVEGYRMPGRSFVLSFNLRFGEP